MALFKCIDCGQEVSSEALSCPHCGRPTNAGASENPIKVEPLLISMGWKKAKLISWFVTILGFVLMFSGEPTFERMGFNVGFSFFFSGLIALFISKIGAWYNDRRDR